MLQGLGESDARALLAAAIRAPLDERVRDRVLAEARGNPLALVELPRTAGLAGMAGGFAQPNSVPGVIEQSFRFRLGLLPPAARLLVTVAAADPIGDPGLLWGPSTQAISCVVYNQAPFPPATVQVDKQWVVNGVTYANGTQPPGLSAQLTLDGTPAGFGSVIPGFARARWWRSTRR